MDFDGILPESQYLNVGLSEIKFELIDQEDWRMVQSVIILSSRNGWNSAAEYPKCLLISRSQLQFLLFDFLWSSIPFPNWLFSQKLSSAQDTAHYWAFFSPKTICLTFSPPNILSCHKRVPSSPLTWASCCLVHPLFPHLTSSFLNYLLFLKLSASPFYRIFPSLFLNIYGLPSVWGKKSCLIPIALLAIVRLFSFFHHQALQMNVLHL